MTERIRQDTVDANWERYMQRPRAVWELVDRLRDPKLDEQYQKRILEILLTPELEKLGFNHNLRAGKKGNLLGEAVNLDWKRIPSSVSFAAQVIRTNLVLLKSRSDKVAPDARVYYSVIISNVFPSLSQVNKETLFSYFQFDEVISDFNRGESRQLDPLAIFYHNSDIPLEWKTTLSERVHGKIMEQSAKKRTLKERLTKKSLAERYSEIIRNIGFSYKYGGARGQLQGLFISEVRFLLRNSALSPVFFRQDELIEVLKYLKTFKDDGKQLFILHYRVNGFKVNTNYAKDIALKMSNAFPDDTRLVKSLRKDIERYDKEERMYGERREIIDREEAEEAELTAGLRKKH